MEDQDALSTCLQLSDYLETTDACLECACKSLFRDEFTKALSSNLHIFESRGDPNIVSLSTQSFTAHYGSLYSTRCAHPEYV